MRKPQVVPDEDHEVIYQRVAAVDVAKASGVVCLRGPDTKRPGRYVNRIWDNVPATRARIAELGEELLRCQVQMVTLESTSDYWRIWYYVLESAGLAVVAMVQALTDGERDPRTIADLAKGSLRGKRDALAEALDGMFDSQHGLAGAGRGAPAG